ncbi:MAG: NifB/NifX family molybdenum-iron cluster-binding protein [Thermodesulfobacteriota bacterium]
MDRIKVAFATDNGKTFINRHFGDADFYDIYEINENNADFLKRITNTIEEVKNVHADPEKAKGIAGLLKKEGVQVVVSKKFGPNIKRIKKKFVCIIMADDTINTSLKSLCENIRLIFNEWAKSEKRKHLVL